MMSTISAPTLYSRKKTIHHSTSHEPMWAIELREEAARMFDSLPLPARIDEPWRRTDLTSVKFEQFLNDWDEMANGETSESLIPEEGFCRIHTGQGTQPARGELYMTERRCADSVDGLTVIPVALAVHAVPDIIKPYLRYYANPGLHPSMLRFNAAVYAFRNAGVFVDVADRKKIMLPIGIVAKLFTENTTLYTHNVIHVGRDASLEIAEEFVSPGDRRALLSHSHTHIILEEGAQLRFTGLQNWGTGVFHFGTHQFTIGAHANADVIWGGLGSRIAKSRIIVDLAGEGATAKIGGFVAGNAKQFLDHDTMQHHIARNTNSDLLFKGVVTDRARSVYQGLIVVDKAAQRTDAYQSVKHIILSKNAHVDALPGLEILADDVRCTHGATTSQVNEEQLYYMACRGLSRTAAEELLIEAHLEPILARIPNVELQNRCRDTISMKLLGHSLD
ncbi:MAG: Fe-S cluster assembly protein SufD [bacterium]|nr:Fe-S cluster assembly protein SufD [bacterium]